MTDEQENRYGGYGDGEVRRYGAGESYRPFNRDRSPRARSPPRERESGPPASDSYVPTRLPRRRSRSPDRYRVRDGSREVDTWRRRDRSRSRSRPRDQPRRISPRRSPLRRSPPRYTGPRIDERMDRARSPPRRDFDPRDIRYDLASLARYSEPPEVGLLTTDSSRRSRSPFDRDRPLRTRSPPPFSRGGATYRPRSRSPDNRDRDRDREDRYGEPSHRRPSPPRGSFIPSAITSRSASRRSSPHPNSRRGRDDRSRPQSPSRSPRLSLLTSTLPFREAPRKMAQEPTSAGAKSPPKGPAASRAPPTGPSAVRTPAQASVAASPQQSRYPAVRNGSVSRPDAQSPTAPPSGPRGYLTSRGGGYAPRGGRGAWQGVPRHIPAPPASPTMSNNPSGIPTGPRVAATMPSPAVATKPFNPPTGPSSHAPVRPTLAQNMIASMPPIAPCGKLEPSATAMATGVIKELEPHHRKLKEDEERIRDELKQAQEKLRKSLRLWNRTGRESKSLELKAELSERTLSGLARTGDGLGGAAF